MAFLSAPDYRQRGGNTKGKSAGGSYTSNPPVETSQDGRNTGAVFMWTPGARTFQRLDGTELPVNNGIETSDDGREFFVVSMGLRQIVDFSRADPSKPIGFA